MPRTSRTLADLGESALIDRIARRAGRPPGRDWALGIGDDAAILRPRPGDELVLTTDAQIEGVHFRLTRETPRTVGRRALAVNLSDLAAMGAEPVGALLALAAPPDLALSDFDSLIAGFVAEGRTHACPLVGGNLARAERLSLDVTVVGRCRLRGALRRRGLRPGDGLYVTGVLGAAALARARADREGSRLVRVPTPRLAAGRVLARRSGTRACIDLSDGLGTDLPHLLRADGLGAEVDAEVLPRPRGFERACAELGLDPLSLMVSGGEDYELLFAHRDSGAGRREGQGVAGALASALGIPVTRIGRVVAEPGVRGLPAGEGGHHF